MKNLSKTDWVAVILALALVGWAVYVIIQTERMVNSL